MGLGDLSHVLTIGAFSPQLEHETMNLDTGVAFPRWPIGVPSIDNHVMIGGGIGLTTLAGDSGAGKSTVGYSAAAHCLEAGWQVFYWDGENSDHQAKLRLHGAFTHLGVPNWMQKHLAKNGGLFSPRKMRPGITVEHIADYVSMHHEPLNRVLVVIDSVNRFAEFSCLQKESDNPHTYWRMIRKLTVWAMLAKDILVGECAFLLVSETNKDGIAKGRALDFASDLAVSIRKSRGREREVIVTKARDGGDGPLGPHYLSVERSRLERVEDAEIRRQPARITAEISSENVIPFTNRRML